jgi:hypothetical protein
MFLPIILFKYFIFKILYIVQSNKNISIRFKFQFSNGVALRLRQ